MTQNQQVRVPGLVDERLRGRPGERDELGRHPTQPGLQCDDGGDGVPSDLLGVAVELVERRQRRQAVGDRPVLRRDVGGDDPHADSTAGGIREGEPQRGL